MMREPIGSEEIFMLPEGAPISLAQLLDSLHMTRVIFLGEVHDQTEHHQIQLKILRSLAQKGKDLVVAMEMFERSQQPILDRWSQGLLTEEQFLKEIQWETTWGIDYNLYKGILDEIRERHFKIIGLNIERELVRKVAQNGIEGLSPGDRKKLPEMDLTDPLHRAYIASIYKTHQGGSAKDFENFYQAQCLWDEAMAETLSQFFKSPGGREKTVLVLVGNGHIVFDLGVPKRFYRRTPIPYKTIAMKEWRKKMDEELTFNEAPSPLADFLWVTRPTPPGKKRPRIGLFLKEKDDFKELWIERVVPESPAERAGLLPGDRLVAVEGKAITKMKDIHDAFVQKGWGKDINVTIIRDGMRKEVTVTLPPLPD
jgi:uncharacterized iron-regulated protein